MAKNENLVVTEDVKPLNFTGGKLYSKPEVKRRSTVSGISGALIGVIGTITAGVILSKTANINITTAATKLVDDGIEKIKSSRRDGESVDDKEE
jgi:hypothetical protein